MRMHQKTGNPRLLQSLDRPGRIHWHHTTKDGTAMNQAYLTALRSGVRVFHDLETDTIRTYPENYCLAARTSPDSPWYAYVDVECPVTAEDIRSWLERFRDESDESLVEILGGILSL